MIGSMSDVSKIIDIVINRNGLGKTDFLILLLLSAYGPHTVSELAEKVKLSRGWIYQVLRWLKHYDYVKNISTTKPARFAFCG